MNPSTASLDALYRRVVRRRFTWLILLLAVVLACVLADLCVGPSGMSPRKVLTGIFNRSTLDVSERIILWEIRLPYALMAVCVGFALGLAGAQMQTVLDNPLASPYTLGLASAATLGASLAIVFRFNPLGLPDAFVLPTSAFVFAFAITCFVQWVGRRLGGGSGPLILLGVAMLFLCNALIALIQFTADANAVQEIVFWTMGSLARSDWPRVACVAAVIGLLFPLTMRRAWMLSLMKAGEDQARAAGAPVDRLRITTLLTVSVLAAVAVAFVGSIGFIGLVGPHIARLAFGEDHRFYLPGAALSGALILSLASIASKTLIHGVVLPIGIVTALVGIPLFIALVFTQRRFL